MEEIWKISGTTGQRDGTDDYVDAAVTSQPEDWAPILDLPR